MLGTTEIEKFPAVDGKQSPRPSWWQAGAGAWGCFQSHLRILQRAANEGWERTLILEDDAEPIPGRGHLQEWIRSLPDGWDQAYIGGQMLWQSDRHPKFKTTLQPEEVSPGVWLCKNVNRTHGYAVSRGGVLTLLEHLAHPAWVTRPKSHIDHWYGVGHEREVIRAYAPRQWFIRQAAGVSDVGKKTEKAKEWAWHPR